MLVGLSSFGFGSLARRKEFKAIPIFPNMFVGLLALLKQWKLALRDSFVGPIWDPSRPNKIKLIWSNCQSSSYFRFQVKWHGLSHHSEIWKKGNHSQRNSSLENIWYVIFFSWHTQGMWITERSQLGIIGYESRILDPFKFWVQLVFESVSQSSYLCGQEYVGPIWDPSRSKKIKLIWSNCRSSSYFISKSNHMDQHIIVKCERKVPTIKETLH